MTQGGDGELDEKLSMSEIMSGLIGSIERMQRHRMCSCTEPIERIPQSVEVVKHHAQKSLIDALHSPSIRKTGLRNFFPCLTFSGSPFVGHSHSVIRNCPRVIKSILADIETSPLPYRAMAEISRETGIPDTTLWSWQCHRLSSMNEAWVPGQKDRRNRKFISVTPAR
jgi:hypothetical protein